MRRARRAITALLLSGVSACSSAPPDAHNAPLPSATISAGPNASTRARLQGTWELVAFDSLTPIPDDASPILSKLHGAVRLRFEADSVTTFLPGKTEQETCGYQIEAESGDTFTLVTSAGMFRKAQARFLSADLWEATENGPLWPGTTRFARVKR